MTSPMTPPKHSPLVASPKMIDGVAVTRTDTRTDEEKRKELQVSRTFKTILSPDH